MALYLLNISVDTPDPNAEFIAEDLSINDQESIIELVVEHLFGYENAIQEYDDHDSENHTKAKNIKIDLLVYVNQVLGLAHCQLKYINRPFADHDARLTIGITEIEGPPPKI